MRFIARVALGPLLLFVTATALATSARGSTVDAYDAGYVRTNAQANLTEIAETHSHAKPTRQLAARIVSDHTSAQRQLRLIAGEIGVPMPTALSPAQQQQLAQLKAAPAKDFDLTYLRMQLDDHTTAIANARGEVAKGRNSALVSYAKTALPTLLLHRRMATAALTDIQDQGAATAPPSNARPAPSNVVTSGPEAYGAKKSHSDDVPWLIALVVVIGLGLLAGGLYLRRAVRPRNHL